MIEICRNDENIDIAITEPDLAIDLVETFKTGILRGAAQEVSYENYLKSPDEVGDYVRDPLDALQLAKEKNESLSQARKDARMRREEKVSPTEGEQA